MAAPAWASLGSLLPSRLSPTAPSPRRSGVSDEPCRLSRHHLALSSRAPGCGGHFARSRGLRVPGACAVLFPAAPGGGAGSGASRPRRAPSAVRGGAIGRLLWDGPRHRGLLRRIVWTYSAICFRVQGYIPCCPSLRRDPAAALSYLGRL